MASAKETFAAAAFACGTWRGIGVTPAFTYDSAGIEVESPDFRLHAACSGFNLHIKSPDHRLHARTKEY
jgi:hypothetical protein